MIDFASFLALQTMLVSKRFVAGMAFHLRGMEAEATDISESLHASLHS
jgi:hypothetical protein